MSNGSIPPPPQRKGAKRKPANGGVGEQVAAEAGGSSIFKNEQNNNFAQPERESSFFVDENDSYSVEVEVVDVSAMEEIATEMYVTENYQLGSPNGKTTAGSDDVWLEERTSEMSGAEQRFGDVRETEEMYASVSRENFKAEKYESYTQNLAGEEMETGEDGEPDYVTHVGDDGEISHVELENFDNDILRSVDSLLTYITDDVCTEVLINGPNECSRKVQGSRYHSPDVRFGDAETYHAVLNRFILPYCDTGERIDGKNVVIEGQLELSIPPGRPPMYARVHIIAPPGVKHAKVTIAKKPRSSITLDKMVKGGTMSQNAADFLKAIARGHKTFVVSGPTGAGKSTMLQALTYYFDPADRVVVVEETPELQLPLGDVVYLKSTLELPGQNPSDIYSLGFWVKQANRMRMDRVIVGETRGAELSEWLIAANSGAEGSATTVHAETPRRTLDKMLSLAAKGSVTISENQIRREIAATVDIIVQLGFVNNRHVVTAVEEVSNTIANQTGQVQTNTIFAFDKETNTHVVKGRPSDGLVRSLAAQGIPVNQQWFQQGN